MKTFLLLIFCVANAYGQGTIKGLVSDSLSSGQLKGAEIILTGTNFSTVSNINGGFNIIGIPAGDYILQASYLGYKEKKILVNIKPEKALSLNIKLLPAVTVENKTPLGDQAKSQLEEINLQVSSNTIGNVIAGEKLQDMPDENIPVALSRLPGVSIMYNSVPVPSSSLGYSIVSPGPYFTTTPQGDFSPPEDPVARVLIRGLDAGYYNVTINGIRIPPASAVDKSIDLNNLSERDFQNIELHKTITSDEDGDATAGAINMITERAPYKRMIKVEALGNYNGLDSSDNQYNFTGIYGERFFNNKLGVLASVHIEKKIMSNESQNTSDNFLRYNSSYTNAVRKRNGADILLDYVTPDGGSITFQNIFNKTNTDNFKSMADSLYGFPPSLRFNEKKTEQELFLSSLGGSNHLFGFDVDWNAAFSESRHNQPYNYSLSFKESYDLITGRLLGNYYLNHSLDIPTKNYSKEKTVSLDIHKKYALSNEITGELKLGGKYRINSGSYFEESHLGIENPVKLSNFKDSPPGERIVLGNYLIPLINKDSLRSWRQFTLSKYDTTNGADINSYDLSQSVSAGYIMHTFNFRGSAIFITGLRIENEHNDYYGYYFPYVIPGTNLYSNVISQFILYNALPEKTRILHYNKTTILPNFQMILKPTGYLNLRLAVYKTLIRPPAAARMPRYFAISAGTSPYLYYLNMGNPDLKNADVWNYEFQVQFHGKDIGQFTINAFYKGIEGMVQATNGILLSDSVAVKSFRIDWRNYVGQFPATYGNTDNPNGKFNLFSYFNSSKPTRVWGFEFSHQANFRYLPGLLKNIVLNYNFTFLRSEAWTKDASSVYTRSITSRGNTVSWHSIFTDRSKKLSDMPDFFLNANLAYDIDGFSFRISYFYQDEYKMYDNSVDIYDPSNLTQIKRNRYSRLDIAVRQRILKHIFFNLSLNNITNSKEESLIKSGLWYSYSPDWKTAQAYIYGFNMDFGVGIEL